MLNKYGAISCAAIAAASACQGAWAQQRGAASGEREATATSEVVLVYGDRQIDDPGSVSVIGPKEIEFIRADHPAEIVNTVPGVNVQMNSGQENLIAVRSPVLTGGAAQGSFLILQNGVPIRAPAFGNVNTLFEVHHEAAEAIEVVRGPGSVRYGSNAVNGLLNFIHPLPSDQPAASLTASVSTLQRARVDAAANFSMGGVDNFAALSVTDDNGWRDASGVDMQKLSWRSGWDVGGWRAIASLSAVNLNQETAGYIEGPEVYKDEDIASSNPSPEAYRDAWSARTDLHLQRDFGQNRLSITPYAIAQRMIFIQHFLPDQSTEKNGHDALGVIARYDFGPDDVRWSVGGEANWADGYLREIQSEPFGFFPSDSRFPVGLHYDYDVSTLNFAAFGELDWDFAPDWSLLAGLRAETHDYDYNTNLAPGDYGRFRVPPSREDTFDFVTPKLGVVWSGAAWGDVYANYARGARAPQVSDQYRLRNTQAIEALEVETVDSFELGTRGVMGPVNFDIAAYTYNKDNYFFRDADGLNVPDGKTDHTGIEAALDGDLAGGFFWTANLSWSDQTYAFTRDVGLDEEDITEGDRIDTAPEWLGDAGIGWSGGPYSVLLSVEHVGEYFTNAANTATYDGHTVLHLRGAWHISEQLEAFVIVRNLTDERYADRADYAFGNDRYFPGEPLNATFGVRLRQ